MGINKNKDTPTAFSPFRKGGEGGFDSSPLASLGCRPDKKDKEVISV